MTDIQVFNLGTVTTWSMKKNQDVQQARVQLTLQVISIKNNKPTLDFLTS